MKKANILINICKTLAKYFNLPIFVLTDGASGYSNNKDDVGIIKKTNDYFEKELHLEKTIQKYKDARDFRESKTFVEKSAQYAFNIFRLSTKEEVDKIIYSYGELVHGKYKPPLVLKNTYTEKETLYVIHKEYDKWSKRHVLYISQLSQIIEDMQKETTNLIAIKNKQGVKQND